MESLNRSRPSVAAHALGICRAAFKDMVNYMNEREQSSRRVIDFQGNQFMLADLAGDSLWWNTGFTTWGNWWSRASTISGWKRRLPSYGPATLLCACPPRRFRCTAVTVTARLPCRAVDARCQDHSNLGRHQPGSSSVNRPELCSEAGLTFRLGRTPNKVCIGAASHRREIFDAPAHQA